MFSGGTYEEVGRWLKNFLTSHAKRVNPRAEIELDDEDEREGSSYGATFRLAHRVSPVLEFSFTDVAANRGSLAWCQRQADVTGGFVREHLLGVATAAAR